TDATGMASPRQFAFPSQPIRGSTSAGRPAAASPILAGRSRRRARSISPEGSAGTCPTSHSGTARCRPEADQGRRPDEGNAITGDGKTLYAVTATGAGSTVITAITTAGNTPANPVKVAATASSSRSPRTAITIDLITSRAGAVVVAVSTATGVAERPI